MDEALINRIEANVLVLSPDTPEDDFLTYIVNEVIDRVLVYTNREQLVARYLRDLENYSEDDSIWDSYDYPIPRVLERVISGIVVSSIKTVQSKRTAKQGSVASMSDNGQSVSFNKELQAYMYTSDDTEVFAGTTKILDKFRLPTVNGSY